MPEVFELIAQSKIDITTDLDSRLKDYQTV